MTKTTLALVFAVCLSSFSALAADDATLPPPPPPPPSAQAPTAQPRTGYQPPVTLGYQAPRRVKYEGGLIPEYAHIETEPRKGLIISGAAVLGASYALSVLVAIGYCGPGRECQNGALYIPVVGPFIVAAMAPSTGGATLAAFDGVVQLAGLGLLIAGFAAPEKFVVWRDADAHASLSLVPGGGGGVGVLLKY
ncbi:MAG: hypothetical protein U0228_21395 [Myxococcaceae bacterium]